MSTWSNARATLGDGTPQDGAEFDRSTQLRQAQSGVKSAAPGAHWTGTAADAYGEANSKQGRALGQMAVLDQRLGAEVDRSAAVVHAGRQNLDAVKQWMLDAAASVPPGADREQMLTPIARKGIADVADVVKQSNSELNVIGGRIRAIGNEYRALGGPMGSPKKSPPTTTSPTPDPPQCKPEDQAKIIARAAELKAKNAELTAAAKAWNEKYEPGHKFDMRDPVQAAEYERGQKLSQDRAQLIRDYGNLIKDATTCGAKEDEETGDIIWPDGTRTTLYPPH